MRTELRKTRKGEYILMKFKQMINKINTRFPRLIIRLVFMFVVLLVFGVINEGYLTWSNIIMVVTQQAPYFALLAFGMTTAILLGGIDLSIGSVMTLSACLCAMMLKMTGNVFISITVAMFAGMSVGVINGLLITKIKLPPFIATYGMDWVIKGTVYILMGGLSIFDFPTSFRSFGTGNIFGLPNLFIAMVVVFGLLLFLFHKSTYGNRFYAVARNPNATKLSGISVSAITTASYVLTGVLASIAGMLYIANLNAAEASLGEGWNLKLIAITLIGGTQMSGGVGSIANTLVGVFIYLFIMNGLNISGISLNWQDAIVGSLVILSVLIELVGSKMQGARKSKSAA